uniref:Uncharacterized protein n=1 Tax=uncultured prokaryote TaxID=198431 RepID=A0A0H5Q782_9ZZZZ|nr:hypothetical protein [uncultured prokaryote]
MDGEVEMVSFKCRSCDLTGEGYWNDPMALALRLHGSVCDGEEAIHLVRWTVVPLPLV